MNQTGLRQTRPKSIYRHQIFLRETLTVGSAVNSDIRAVRTRQTGQPIITFNKYNENYMEKPKSLRVSKIRICTLVLSQEMSTPILLRQRLASTRAEILLRPHHNRTPGPMAII